MAGFVSLGDGIYDGTVVCGEADGVQNGHFVKVTVVNGVRTGKLVADDTEGDGDVYFVENELDIVPEQMINDIDFVVKNGKYLRLYYPERGEEIKTTMVSQAFVVGDVAAVGTGGVLEPIGTRTPKFKFEVVDVTNELSVATYSCKAL